MKIINYIVNKYSSTIFGKRPNYTIFSFNYHNVKPINTFLQSFIDSLNYKDEISLLDVGGGASPYYEIFEKKVNKFVVVDLKDSLPKDEHRKIEQYEGFAEVLPFENNSFDILLSNQVLEHVNDDVKAISEKYRVLKPGGWLVGSLPHVSPIHLEPYDFRRFTALGVKKSLGNAGFTDIKVYGNGSVYKSAVLLLTMDWLLSDYEDNKSQRFNNKLHFFIFPIIGMMNISAIVLEKLLGDSKRSPSNYCFSARKV